MQNATPLQKVAEWRHSDGRQILNVPDVAAGWELALTADRADELGLKLWELTVRRTQASGDGNTILRTWADRAGRVTGLLEPLRLLEVDDARGEALLRSDGPSQRGDQLYFYELLARADEATLRRYQASYQPGTRREQVPFVLSH